MGSLQCPDPGRFSCSPAVLAPKQQSILQSGLKYFLSRKCYPRYEGVVREPHAGPDARVSTPSTLSARRHAENTALVEPGVGPDYVGVAADGEGGEDEGHEGQEVPHHGAVESQ